MIPIGYQTYFNGEINIEPPLNAAEIAYLKKLNETRRVNRTKGPYFVDGTGAYGQGADPDIIDHNSPDPSQPGLWCQWVPTEDGTAIEWDEGEKAYEMGDWLLYIIEHFLRPGAVASTVDDPQFAEFTFDHICNGEVYADGEESDDFWSMRVVDNVTTFGKGEVIYSGEYERQLRPLLDEVARTAAGTIAGDSPKAELAATRAALDEALVLLGLPHTDPDSLEG